MTVLPYRRTNLVGRSFTVLYVEDDPESRLLIRRVLQAEGYAVIEAKDAADGLASATEQRPDLILIDINLPEVDGLTLARQIKSVPDLASTPVVALTANVMRGDRERSLGAGCDGYIQKPIDVDLLPRQISQYLRSKG
ncbi:MAG: two-component system response regulator [Chloroflexi bacterium RBG_19FT_COMBO_62_14]|nr:MAG: two-component system response regulator [Chloroflexi bacterium RBG_19FT_COMBO_62_14]